MCSYHVLKVCRDVHKRNIGKRDSLAPSSRLDLHLSLLQGKLLQLELPAEVKPSLATAQRSNATGSLVLAMPKAHPDAAHCDIACSRWSCLGMLMLGSDMA